MSEQTPKDWKKFKEEQEAQLFSESSESEPTEAAAESETVSLEHPSYASLEEKLTLTEQKMHENWEKALRAQAELDNVRRRAERDVANAHRYGLEKMIQSLIPVLDSLEQALQLAEQHGDTAMHEGINLTLKLFTDVLQKHEVEILDPMGLPFDPQQHEAMTMQSVPGAAANSIVAVFQKGVRLNDRIIRPARVVVAKAD